MTTDQQSCLIADTREDAVIPYLSGWPYLKVEQITVGDYAIMIGGAIVAIFERKTLSDYGQSIRDGRAGNKMKLLDLRSRTACQIFYIVEGAFQPAQDSEFGGVKYSSIESSINHLQTEHAISIVRTASRADTAAELKRKFQSYLERDRCSADVMRQLRSGILDLDLADYEVVIVDGRCRIVRRDSDETIGANEVAKPSNTDATSSDNSAKLADADAKILESLRQRFDLDLTVNPNQAALLKMREQSSKEVIRAKLWRSLDGFGDATAVKMANRPVSDYLADPNLASDRGLTARQQTEFRSLFSPIWTTAQDSFLSSVPGLGPKNMATLRSTYTSMRDLLISREDKGKKNAHRLIDLIDTAFA